MMFITKYQYGRKKQMDKSVDDIIKEAMEKKHSREVSKEPKSKPDKPQFDNTAAYLIPGEINADETDKALIENDDVTIPQDVFDSIISKRSEPVQTFDSDEKKTDAGKSRIPDFISSGADDNGEDLASLGIAGKEGKKITDYTSKEFKKDDPKHFDKAYYEKFKLTQAEHADDVKSLKNKNTLKKNGKRKWSVKKKILVIVIIVLAVLLLLAGAATALIHHYISKMNIVTDPDTSIASSIVDDDLTDDPDSPKSEIDAMEAMIKANMESGAESLMFDDNVMNVLVIGTDSRGGERGRSDSMILMSINKKTEEIVMTSFLRDIYLSIPGVGSSRLNHAYAYGGAELLMDTIEQNFKIKIDKYVKVDFNSFVDVIDSVGGVEINVTDEELQYFNSYLGSINKSRGLKTSDSKLDQAGTYNLNGRQALAYSRIRYVGTDFGRTQRQRTIMTKVLEKAKDLSLFEMNGLLNVLLPEITTNLTEGEIFSLVLNSMDYLGYDTVSQCIPQDNTYSYLTVSGMSVLGIDFNSSIAYLKKTIYDK